MELNSNTAKQQTQFQVFFQFTRPDRFFLFFDFFVCLTDRSELTRPMGGWDLTGVNS